MEYWKYAASLDRVLECAAAALRGKKSKIEEVFFDESE